jgi:hypothetical protein
MVKPNQPASVCSTIANAETRAVCEEQREACEHARDERAVNSCNENVSFCAENMAWPASLETDHGRYNALDRSLCFRLASIFTKQGYMLRSAGAYRPTETKKDETPPQQQSTPHGQATDAPPRKPGPETLDATTICTPLRNNPQSMKACTDTVQFCSTNETWPERVKTRWRDFLAVDRTACMKFASIHAYLLKTHTRDEAAPTPEQPPVAEKKQTPTVDRNQTPRGIQIAPAGNRQIKAFSDCGIRRLSMTGNAFSEVRRTLHFPNGKGLPIKLRYSLKPLNDGGLVSMEYTIFRGRTPIGGQQSILFQPHNDGLHLGFEIHLARSNDYSRIDSMSIISLD